MLRLTTFDGVSLTRDGQPVSAIASRRLSVALLLILALRGARGIAREALMELLWPDNAVKDPRHSLDQLLTVTRALTGQPDLFSGTSTLTLASRAIETDVDAFESARRDQRYEELAALYRAAFAEGFSFSASPALEELIDNARTRFAIEHAAAVRKLAERAEGRQLHGEAAGWWKVLYEVDQLDRSVALRLIASLALDNRNGDALRIARAASAAIFAEYGNPDADLERWIARLEDGRKGVATPEIVERAELTGAKGADKSSGAALSADSPVPVADWLNRVVGGRYRLEKILRSGRIATVFLAVDTKHAGSLVEVQLLEPPVAACMPPDHFSQVFRQVIQLSHPNVLPTFDAGSEGGLRYIVTAVSRGTLLHERLRQNKALPIAEAVEIAMGISGALAHAHGRGVLHGDLRPKAVMISQSAIVSGFGLADSIRWSVDGNGSAILTLGSTVYHSPEQLMGEVRIDMSSDVYALGCMLFEMLAGEPPFGGKTRPNRMLKLSEAAPSVREFRETVPDDLANIVQRCLARVPADRFESGIELFRAISQVRPRTSVSS